MYSVFTQQPTVSYDVVVPVVPGDAVAPVAVAAGPVAVKMPSRPAQEPRAPEKVRSRSPGRLVVRLSSPTRLPVSETVMKTRLLASVSEESGPGMGAASSKALVATSVGRRSPAQIVEPIVIRLFPVSAKSRLATTARERRKSQGKTTCCRCACRARSGKPTTSTGTDTETDQAEVTGEDSHVCSCEADVGDKQEETYDLPAEPHVARTRVPVDERAAVEPPVTRTKSRNAARDAFSKISEACGRPRLADETVFCHRDRMLTMIVGGGLMVGSLLIALLLLLVVGYRDKNVASAATAVEENKKAASMIPRKIMEASPIIFAFLLLLPTTKQQEGGRIISKPIREDRANIKRFFNTSEATWTFLTTETSNIECKVDVTREMNRTFVKFETSFSLKGFRVNVTNFGEFEKLYDDAEKRNYTKYNAILLSNPGKVTSPQPLPASLPVCRVSKTEGSMVRIAGEELVCKNAATAVC
ncbi:hypothetical protein HPB50_013485 [Hyalomma asiaticum]|uniref:Uncharacterized protein n=1 Tax=Hyalomma asiaticum TaxID=266040 RepID=A0ACB7RZV3_HYAAI|nr:hypothetical protein HPB50_013485 [Hyalomma asiaticum]